LKENEFRTLASEISALIKWPFLGKPSPKGRVHTDDVPAFFSKKGNGGATDSAASAGDEDSLDD